MDRLKRHIAAMLKKGNLPNAAQLLRYSARNRLGLGRPDIRSLLATWPGVPPLKEFHGKGKYMGMAYFRYGVVQIDFASFKPQWRRQNGGNVGFLVAVEASSGQLAVEPVAGKSMEQHRLGLDRCLTEGVIDRPSLIQTDREAVMMSPRYLQELREEYGIRVHYIKARNKAWKAERAVRFVKQALSRRLAMSGASERNWTRFVAPLVKEFNARAIGKTGYLRRDVNHANFTDYMAKKWKVPDPTALFNLATVTDTSIKNRAWKRKLWRYRRGTKVLLLDRAEHRSGAGGSFKKVSETGRFDRRRPYYVVSRALKSSGDFSLIPGKASLA